MHIPNMIQIKRHKITLLIKELCYLEILCESGCASVFPFSAVVHDVLRCFACIPLCIVLYHYCAENFQAREIMCVE